MDELVWPPFHRKVVPEEAVALSEAVLAAQVMTLSGPALTVGLFVFTVTDTTSEAVHPLRVLVAVTV